jgi:hypothetical protein
MMYGCALEYVRLSSLTHELSSLTHELPGLTHDTDHADLLGTSP